MSHRLADVVWDTVRLNEQNVAVKLNILEHNWLQPWWTIRVTISCTIVQCNIHSIFCLTKPEVMQMITQFCFDPNCKIHTVPAILHIICLPFFLVRVAVTTGCVSPNLSNLSHKIQLPLVDLQILSSQLSDITSPAFTESTMFSSWKVPKPPQFREAAVLLQGAPELIFQSVPTACNQPISG